MLPHLSWPRYSMAARAGELIPELARHGLQQLIELEASAAVGADRHERSEERTN